MKKLFEKQNRILSIFAIVALVAVAFGMFMADAITAVAFFATVPLVAWIADGKFKELSKEELENLPVEDLAKYHAAYIEYKNSILEGLIKTKSEDNAKQIKELKDDMFNALQNLTKQLNQALETQVKNNQRKDVSIASLKTTVDEMMNSVKDDLSAIAVGTKSGSVVGSIKSAVAMTFASSSTNIVVAPYMIPGVNDIRKRNPFMLSLVNAETTDTNLIYWVEEVAQEGGAGTTTEGNAKSQVQYKFIGRTQEMEKETIYAEVSKEFLKYPKFMNNFIRTKMLVDLNNQIDAKITAAIIAKSTAFAAGDLALTVSDPNLNDVIIAATNQAEINHFYPSYVCLHPTDSAKLKLVKDKNNQYVIAPFATADGTIIDGLRVITNTGITAGKCLVFDPSLVTVWVGENVTFEMGLNGDNFKENMKALLAEAEMLTIVGANNKLGIIYADIADAITALTKVVA